jgi:hypothetical protein
VKYLRDKVKNLVFQDRFDILLEIKLSGVAEQIMQGYTGNPGNESLVYQNLIARTNWLKLCTLLHCTSNSKKVF